MKNWSVRAWNCSKRLTSTINCVFSVQHACGISTTPTLLAQFYADATVHAIAQAQCWKRSSSHKTAMLQYYATVATERTGYVLYRALVITLCTSYPRISLMVKDDDNPSIMRS